jgi:polar amino acid transport system substrate-binding protein
MQGILVDTLKGTLEDDLKIDVQYIGLPWKRAQSMVETGIADAFITVPTKKRLKYSQCSNVSALTVKVGIYTYAENPRMNELMKIKTYDDLKGFSIIDYIGNGWAKSKFKNLDVTWMPTLNQTFMMLASKRADILVRNNYNFDFFSRSLNIQNKIIKLPAILSSVDFHLCINKNSPFVNRLDDFDKSIIKFKNDGAQALIINKYKH